MSPSTRKKLLFGVGTVSFLIYIIIFLFLLIFSLVQSVHIIHRCSAIVTAYFLIGILSIANVIYWSVALYLMKRKNVANIGGEVYHKLEGKYGGVTLEQDETGYKVDVDVDVDDEHQDGWSLLRKLLGICSFCTAISVIIVLLSYIIFVGYIKAKVTPLYHGEMHLPGLNADVEIKRDYYGVVHVIATNEDDLFFGQGVATAQDRLFQMELNRRVAFGRLSEVVGQSALDVDKLMRTLGIGQAAQKDVEKLPPDIKTTLDSYCAGINAYLNSTTQLSAEFLILGYTPEPWRPVDVIASHKLLQWTLEGNKNREELRFRMLAAGLSMERIESLLPPYEGPIVIDDQELQQAFFSQSIKHEHHAYIPERTKVQNIEENESVFMKLFNPDRERMKESNNWVFGGSFTKSKKPILANDIHLTTSAPGTFYLMHLQAPEAGIDAIGGSIPGFPGLMTGRNQKISWGITNGGADVQDLFVLTENADKSGYMYKGTFKPYKIRKETIKVKGESDVIFNVTETVFGPVINDVSPTLKGITSDKKIALSWLSTSNMFIDTSVGTIKQLLKAQNWNEFVSAIELFSGPSLNFVYSDVDGNIGYMLGGKFPIRTPQWSGLYPVSGDGSYEWTGVTNGSALPRVKNPAKDYIFSANNKIVPDNYTTFITKDWVSDAYRARRIENLINNSKKGDVDILFNKKIQNDIFSQMFLQHKRIFDVFAFNSSEDDSKFEEFRKLMLAWDGETKIGSIETSIFEEYLKQLSLFGAKEANVTTFYSPRWLFKTLINQPPDEESICKKYHGKTLEQMAKFYFKQTIEYLEGRFGQVPKWGQSTHYFVLNNPILVNSAFKCMSCREAYSGGGTSTINVAPSEGDHVGKSQFGAVYRQIVDMSNPEESLFISSIGMSENWMGNYFDNLLNYWVKGEYVPMKTKDYHNYYTLKLKK